MKIIAEYFSPRGDVKIVNTGKSYKVVFDTKIQPGVSYTKEFSCISYEQALVKFNNIAHIYIAENQARCIFPKKQECICSKADCPQVLGNSKFWDYFSYDCRYKVR